jgi:Spy/CpxP family protein refolding chaperone
MNRRALSTLSAFCLGAFLTSAVWGLRATGYAAEAATEDPPGRPDVGVWLLDEVVSQLDLTGDQAAAIRRTHEANSPGIDRLRTGLELTQAELRATEEAEVFDEARAAGLIVKKAELAAYLWGTRTRVTSEIYRGLTPVQRARFSAVRDRFDPALEQPRIGR